jgi:hypothetical protein
MTRQEIKNYSTANLYFSTRISENEFETLIRLNGIRNLNVRTLNQGQVTFIVKG